MPPTRQNIRRYDSSKVQGPDSFIRIRAITVKEAKALARAAEPPDISDEATEEERTTLLNDHEKKVERMNNEVLGDLVYEWNWVDDDGTPFEQPRGNPDVFDNLTPEELEFITDRMNGNIKSKKN